jgi:energy-coupling factor transporter ATP-binding protein EcfA2
MTQSDAAGSTAAGDPLVVLDHVDKWFGDLHVLQDIELTIHRGEVVVVIGPSGSGKSTLCRTINRLETMQQAMADGFDFVAMGRAVLREPDLVARLAAGQTASGVCIHCNRCVPTIYSGTRCPVRDPHPVVEC